MIKRVRSPKSPNSPRAIIPHLKIDNLSKSGDSIESWGCVQQWKNVMTICHFNNQGQGYQINVDLDSNFYICIVESKGKMPAALKLIAPKSSFNDPNVCRTGRRKSEPLVTTQKGMNSNFEIMLYGSREKIQTAFSQISKSVCEYFLIPNEEYRSGELIKEKEEGIIHYSMIPGVIFRVLNDDLIGIDDNIVKLRNMTICWHRSVPDPLVKQIFTSLSTMMSENEKCW